MTRSDCHTGDGDHSKQWCSRPCITVVHSTPASGLSQFRRSLALHRQGRAAKIAVLQHGGHILPLIADEEDAA
jgi:hypothetical protein